MKGWDWSMFSTFDRLLRPYVPVRALENNSFGVLTWLPTTTVGFLATRKQRQKNTRLYTLPNILAPCPTSLVSNRAFIYSVESVRCKMRDFSAFTVDEIWRFIKIDNERRAEVPIQHVLFLFLQKYMKNVSNFVQISIQLFAKKLYIR